jgi:hypothetical protein
MSPHPIGHERKTITTDDDIFIVLAQLPDISTACSSQSGHESLLGTWIDHPTRRVLVGREELAADGEGLLAVVPVAFELSCPEAELSSGWVTQELPDIGERHAGLP